MLSNLLVVIPSLNLKEDTLDCIRSLERAGARPEQIIVVDNGSTDGTVEALLSEFGPGLQVIANPENLGFAQACNQGFEAALERGAEWVLLLNNDTEADPNFFIEIDKVLVQNLPYRIFAPAIMYHSDPQTIWHMGAMRFPGTLIWRNRYQGKPYNPNFPDILLTDSISGCAMIIHRQVYQQIGLFYAKLFAYWEEVDFCWRADQAGFREAILPKAKLWHKIAKTAGQDQRRTRYLRTRNQLRFYRKYARGAQGALMVTFMFIKILPSLVRDLVTRRAELVGATMDGIRDGWRGF